MEINWKALQANPAPDYLSVERVLVLIGAGAALGAMLVYGFMIAGGAV